MCFMGWTYIYNHNVCEQVNLFPKTRVDIHLSGYLDTFNNIYSLLVTHYYPTISTWNMEILKLSMVLLLWLIIKPHSNYCPILKVRTPPNINQNQINMPLDNVFYRTIKIYLIKFCSTDTPSLTLNL